MEPAFLELDTSRGSLLHHLIGRRGSSEVTPTALAIVACTASVALTYLPLLIAASVSPLPMWIGAPPLRLPFLRDVNVAFMFIVSLPVLVALTVTDQWELNRSLHDVYADGVIVMDPNDAVALAARWRRRFHMVNVASQVVGLIIGGCVAVLNEIIYTQPHVGYWASNDGHLVASGYVYLYCIVTFYTIVSIYVLRSIATSVLLRDVVAHCDLRILPLHPDKAGGLHPVGRLGLRNQYALTICGVNVVLLIWVSQHYLSVPPALYQLIAAAAIAYLVLGPVVFLGPLLPFRSGMLRTKTKLMSEVAQRLRVELRRIQGLLPSGALSKEDEELVDRLRKIGVTIDELPVWPFDTGTLRRFLTAYVIPALAPLVYPLVRSLFQFGIGQLRR